MGNDEEQMGAVGIKRMIIAQEKEQEQEQEQ